MSRAFSHSPTLKQQFQLFVGLLLDPLGKSFAFVAFLQISFAQRFNRSRNIVGVDALDAAIETRVGAKFAAQKHVEVFFQHAIDFLLATLQNRCRRSSAGRTSWGNR